MIEIRQYIDRSGSNPFERWFEKLDDVTQARIMVSLDRLERGNVSTAKSVSKGVEELRLDFGPGYRIYLARMESGWSSCWAGEPNDASKLTSRLHTFYGGNTRIASGRNDATDKKF